MVKLGFEIVCFDHYNVKVQVKKIVDPFEFEFMFERQHSQENERRKIHIKQTKINIEMYSYASRR